MRTFLLWLVAIAVMVLAWPLVVGALVVAAGIWLFALSVAFAYGLQGGLRGDR